MGPSINKRYRIYRKDGQLGKITVMAWAIRHSATKVVRRTTTDTNPPLLPDEDKVQINTAATPPAQFYRISDNGLNYIAASVQEIDDAQVSSAVESAKRQVLIDQLKTAAQTCAALPDPIDPWLILVKRIAKLILFQSYSG